MSKHKRLIYELVSTSSVHPTAEEVFLLAKKETPTIAMATVYNNLNALVKEGMIRRLSVGGADRFDITVRHDHMVCVRCGTLSDVSIPDVTAKLCEWTGEDVLSYDLTVRHVCKVCREKEETSSVQ